MRRGLGVGGSAAAAAASGGGGGGLLRGRLRGGGPPWLVALGVAVVLLVVALGLASLRRAAGGGLARRGAVGGRGLEQVGVGDWSAEASAPVMLRAARRGRDVSAGDGALAAVDAAVQAADGDWRRLRRPEEGSLPPFAAGVRYVARYETDAPGTVVEADLLWKSAPVHVASHMQLIRIGFFNGTAFHRVIPGFIDQTGAPAVHAGSRNAYAFGNEIDSFLAHDRPGLLSSAHAGEGTTFSQFSFMQGKAPHLNGGYTIFGVVSDPDGLQVLATINQGGTRGGKPEKLYHITGATIRAEAM